MYHGIHEDRSSSGNFDPIYSVTPGNFVRQLDYLVENGWQSQLLVDAMSGASERSRQVVISFDDGDASNADPAVQPLLDREMVGEFYITSDRIGTQGSLSASQIRDMADAGMSIQSHGKTHLYLSDLDELSLVDELARSKHALEDISGQEVHTLALPGGRGNAGVVRSARRVGYRFLCGSRLGVNRTDSDPFNLCRIAVTRGMEVRVFASLIRARGIPYWKLRSRQRLLDALKKVMGNERYEAFRERWI